MSIKYICVALATLAAYAVALTQEAEESFLISIAPIIGECSKDYGVSVGAIEAAKTSHSAGGLNNCFVDCVFKKIGIINDQGNFDTEVAKAKGKQLFKDEKYQKKASKIADICASVNAEAVSEQGCERAKLLMDCFLKNEGSFTLSR